MPNKRRAPDQGASHHESDQTIQDESGLSRAESEESIINRLGLCLGAPETDEVRAIYRTTCRMIAMELLERGTAFLPGLGWITVDLTVREDDTIRLHPSFRTSRTMKDEFKRLLREKEASGE